MVEGDLFTLSVLGREMTYEVDQIVTVLPTEMEELLITPGKDYCTLMTCTPYGINTHRLLVRGTRIENPAKQEVAETAASVQPDEAGWQLPVPVFVAAPLATLGLLLIIFLIRMLMRLMNNNNKGKTDQKHKQEDE